MMASKKRSHNFAAARTPAQIEKIVLSTVGSYILDQLLDSDRRAEHKKLCTEALVQHSNNEGGYVDYAEQAVLANLDWGIEAVEEAIRTPHEETKSARLQHAEKMLQVCALLDVRSEIAGIPGTYLSAWGSLILSYVWKLRNDDRKAAVCVLDMFLVDPRSARVKFAPQLWDQLFQPHLTSIKGWYSLQRHRIKMAESDDVSYSFQSREEDGEEDLLTLEQKEQLEGVEGLYQASLDDHTREFAQHYKDWLTLTADSLKKRVPPLMPIAEPPMTPVHELAIFNRKNVENQSLKTYESCTLSSDNTQPEVENVKSNKADGSDEVFNHISMETKSSPSTSLFASTPPKDFVCPITNQIFDDPVTLETGQTYERKAIKEWLSRGNVTCPMSRQPLIKVALPRTNYILKRLISDWKAESTQFSIKDSPQTTNNDYFPTSSGSLTDAGLTGLEKLKMSLETLSRLDNLTDCEAAVRTICQFWEEVHGNEDVTVLLTEPRVIDALMETICKSSSVEVQKEAVDILIELVHRDEHTRQTILTIDPGLQRMQKLLKEGLVDLTVLLLQLRLFLPDIAMADLLPHLVAVIKQSRESTISDGFFQSSIKPKAAAVTMLEHVLSSIELERNSVNIKTLVSLTAVPALIESLNTKDKKERVAAVSILLRCVRADEDARTFVSQADHLTLVLKVLHSADKVARARTIALLMELVRSHKKTSRLQILGLIKTEGCVSSMHALLMHLQVAPLEQQILTAGLLMQLDLLGEPRKDSVYTEEAMDTLLKAIKNKDRLSLQVEAARTIICIVGRFSSSGKPVLRSWLIKASKTKPTKNYQQDDWDKKVARALLDYENGTLLEVLAENVLDEALELATPCITIATWLLYMAGELPETGLWIQARKLLLPRYITLLQSDAHRVLAALALYSFLKDKGSAQELVKSAAAVCKPLKSMRNESWTSSKLYQTFITSPNVKAEEWKHDEVMQADTSGNGEVRALACAKGFLYSGHSDGTIKSWKVAEENLLLLREATEHTKCVTSLAILPSKHRLYSGSLDKTIRVWSIEDDALHCLHVFELNGGVLSLVVTGSLACIILQGIPGIQVQYEENDARHISSHKNIQSVAASKGMIYCGCTDNSVHETDPSGTAMMCIQGGVRTLLGKRPVNALQVFKGQIYTAGSFCDGMNVKVWNQADKSLVSALSIQSEVRSMAMSSEFLYFGLSSGTIEVWLRARLAKVGSLAVGSKLNALAVDGDVLYSGSGDGKIKVWTCL
ncbi:putative E3 ubiquitin-protein ligase LIN [Selaginella moellendorffii]|uniref:putative E3 ubiquitin-protein ligase LIN n=1 Tax=Selaginella moellendorffii TaxID=88036 RepID=UPI000D1D0EED|nr:putative E3 ubiquitin-protein ligase LIN [Selaginella moellendorffii]|eukprot:XP_024545432.1 putative E3 ubiquitin-protein ligase LIN [Selaginella moellendorffii]